MKIDINGSSYGITAWEAAKFRTERQGGTIFGNFVKQVWGSLTNSEDYRATKAKIIKYANIQGFDVDEGKKALKFSAQQYHKAKSTKHQQKIEYQNLEQKMAPYRAKAEEYQAKISPYQEKVDAYKAPYETNRSDFKSQLDSYSEAIKGIKDRQKRRELEAHHGEVTQLFEKYYTAMAGKFVKAGIASAKLKESIENFKEAVQSNADNVQKLQQEVEKQFKEFYDADGQVQSKYWGGLDTSKNTEEMLLRTKLQALDLAIKEAKEAQEK
ncbi:MAG: hypothetical protein LW808_002030 [Verrucomicrobiota bacterium]|nr:MAG: hypothetical protein LW808_002030 [Verrucomicrobiota bacterium]